MSYKVHFEGRIISVQPRIRLLRSFDQRSHSYLGYVLQIGGTMGMEKRRFHLAVGKGTHSKQRFQVGQKISGACEPVADTRQETAEFYKASNLETLNELGDLNIKPPPWLGVPQDLQVYRERRHRRLSSQTYEKYCTSCIWGCRMPVEMIIDQWNPNVKQYRQETFCYGPKSCSVYEAGPIRKVPGRKGMVWEEEDWVDGEETAHRGPDD